MGLQVAARSARRRRATEQPGFEGPAPVFSTLCDYGQVLCETGNSFHLHHPRPQDFDRCARRVGVLCGKRALFEQTATVTCHVGRLTFSLLISVFRAYLFETACFKSRGALENTVSESTPDMHGPLLGVGTRSPRRSSTSARRRAFVTVMPADQQDLVDQKTT